MRGFALRFDEEAGGLVDFEAQVVDSGFEGHDAVVLEAGFGHALDQEFFVGVLGVVFFAELFEEVEQVF